MRGRGTVATDALIVLDDVEASEDDPLVLFLSRWSSCFHPELHLVVASRTQPTLRIARLRAAGEVAYIAAEDLAVRVEDADDFGLGSAARDAVIDIVQATGGWPLAVAVEVSKRGGLLHPVELIEHLLNRTPSCSTTSREDVLANLSESERQLLVLAASIPELSVDLLDAIGCGDLASHLARLTSQRIFLEPVLGRADHVRTTLVGTVFLRRALPLPPAATLDAATCALLRAGDLENALVLSARTGDPVRTREVLMQIGHPDWLSVPGALEAALDIAERGEPHHQLTELRGDLAYQRGEWDNALRLYAESRASTACPLRLEPESGPVCSISAGVSTKRTTCVPPSNSTATNSPRKHGCSLGVR